MYKKKLILFGLIASIVLLFTLGSLLFIANKIELRSKKNISAQSLLFEYTELSNTSYRFFKQLTDERILSEDANQAEIRNKRQFINESLSIIKQIEQSQKAIEPSLFQYHERISEKIMDIDQQFQLVSMELDDTENKARLINILEVMIDQEFREIIDAAIKQQRQFVSLSNADIINLNDNIVLFAYVLLFLSAPYIIISCIKLFNAFYHPIIAIKEGTTSILNGNYDHPITEKLDDEFLSVARLINQLSKRLQIREQEIVENNNRLEDTVNARTRELENANRKLKNADEERKRFLADISHELRTPLTIIRGEAQVTLRLKEAKIEDLNASLKVILSQSVALSQLVDDLLLLSRTDNNALNISLVRFDLLECIEEELGVWRRKIKARAFELYHDVREASVVADRSRIQQVLSILVDNANKYSDRDGAIVVKIEEEDRAFNVSVIDSGKGLSESEKKQIFKRFVRFHRYEDGTGIGLSIAKSIIHAHEGSLTVESMSGKGATFRFTLPKGTPV
ncbi:MAG: ATP-binding protein [Pseudomonadota bacterium]